MATLREQLVQWHNEINRLTEVDKDLVTTRAHVTAEMDKTAVIVREIQKKFRDLEAHRAEIDRVREEVEAWKEQLFIEGPATFGQGPDSHSAQADTAMLDATASSSTAASSASISTNASQSGIGDPATAKIEGETHEVLNELVIDRGLSSYISTLDNASQNVYASDAFRKPLNKAFQHIVWNEDEYQELSCNFCEVNANYYKREFFFGVRGFMFHLSQNHGLSLGLAETLARVNKRTVSETDVQKMRAIPPPLPEEVGMSKRYTPRKRKKKRKIGDMTVEDGAIDGNGIAAYNYGFGVPSSKALEDACRQFPISSPDFLFVLPQAGPGASTGAMTLRHKGRKSYVDDDDDEPLPGGKIDEPKRSSL
ncbi:NAD(+) kinase [Vermiconidia calcicola]|uniref:NAD(+) kinase n=1 Tax=Vermiconidia calcicola TaxID=1690605 RepID=A0ACC3MXC3_9PEZI|nr:NAD(+) kinase [Vermiconidia calcicola]